VGWEELLEKSACLNFGSFLYVVDVELSSKVFQKILIQLLLISVMRNPRAWNCPL